MECERVRDRFSALLEKELSPLEEKGVREHLASCSECQKDLERFHKTIRWLHSIEEAEVPDEFLSGIYRKMEDRKRKGLPADKVRGRWFNYPLSLRLPIQAVAMVATVFLVLYLTKLIPVEGPHLKDVKQAKAPHSEAPQQPLPETPPLKDMEQAKAVLQEEKKAPTSEPERMEKMPMAKEAAPLTAKPPREIILKTSDIEKGLSQVHELVQQFGGEIVTEEGNILLASLPITSFSEFEKELVGMSSSMKADKMIQQKDTMESLSFSAGAKRREVEGKDKESARPLADRESQITVRIRLLQE
jgi:hypothetical protein